SSRGENLAEKHTLLLKEPGKFPRSENENLCRNGRRIMVTWANQPVYDTNGRLREILSVGADVTQQLELLEQLRMTQSTMDLAAEEILWTDAEGRIIYANTAALESTGYGPAAIRQLALWELTVDFPADRWPAFWQDLRARRSATLEFIQTSKSGRPVPMELAATYFALAQKEYATLFLRNLTERRQNEEKRRQHEQQMQHLQRLESLGVLAGGIAHDFNNLLTAILANISLVKAELPAGSPQQESLQEAEKASEQARGLTAQLLTFARGGKPVKTVINLEPVLRNSAGFAGRGRAVRCEIDIPNPLPPVEADATQLSQVFHNLVINAHQAMPHGGLIRIQAVVRPLPASAKALLPPGEYIEISIQDQGQGIAPENLSRIFDPYFTTKKTGSGLGLAVVHAVINQHQGAITVASTPGQGTTFTLWLPASRQTALVPPVSAPAAISRRYRVLIMDDETMVSRVLAKILSRLACDAETALDGREALAKYEAARRLHNPFDLVIMDLTVPGGMGGREMIQQLRRIDPQVKAIVSSGYSDDPVMADFQAHGFTGVILKPYTKEQVQAVVSLLQPPAAA
ncbi:MAG TPA: ATP-binding protein, partial [Verrucomicrobiae bacterium]